MRNSKEKSRKQRARARDPKRAAAEGHSGEKSQLSERRRRKRASEPRRETSRRKEKGGRGAEIEKLVKHWQKAEETKAMREQQAKKAKKSDQRRRKC